VELICAAMEMDQLNPQANVKDQMKEFLLEKQWESLVESVKSKGSGMLKNSLAVCDVSGSMEGVPMCAAIGLTLLAMEISEEPWNSVCLTFSKEPEICHVDPESQLVERIKFLKQIP